MNKVIVNECFHIEINIIKLKKGTVEIMHKKIRKFLRFRIFVLIDNV